MLLPGPDATDLMPPEERPRYSRLIFYVIAEQYTDWQKGVSPTREPRGRGAQNPRLLEAFRAIDRARNRADALRRQQARQEAMIARLQAEMRH